MRLKVNDVSRVGNITPFTVRDHINKGHLTAYKVGPRTWYIRPEHAAQYLGMTLEELNDAVEILM